jgi:hypothetical protein
MERFDFRYESKRPPTSVLRECLAVWTGQLAENGYTLTSQSDVGVSYRRKYWRWYAIALAVLLFPIGLLFLLVKEEATITATIATEGTGSVLLITGTAPRNVRDAFEVLEI